ncbi:MAG: sensor histidine kinase [Anaeromassilibacillus sp.]
MKRLSIHLKVTLWFTLLMVLLVSVVLAFLFYTGAQSALEETKSQMMDMVAAGWREIDADDGEIEIDDDLEYFKDGIYLSVYDAGGVPLYGSVPRDFDNSAVFAPGQLRTIPSMQKSWYVYDEQNTIYGYGTVWIRSVSAANQVDSTISTLYRLALIVLPFFVLFAAVGGYFITRRAFQPVRRIIQTAREIGEGNDLSRRIALGQGRDEVYTLAAEFDSMFARLEKAFEREKQFTSDASHELRTPTTVIISQCEYALERAKTLDEAREALHAILNQAEKMAVMISQLLMLARADKAHGKMQFETVNLSDLAMMVVEQQQENASMRHIQLETHIEPDVEMQGDETMLMRVWINLIENGVKYGREGGWLQVTLQKKQGLIIGCVQDNGIGIAPENLEKVWERFWQADSARSASGAGLGLSMVKWIVQAHGGNIQVESVLGQGSAFTFSFPA